MKMKKLISLFLIVSMCFALYACGNQKKAFDTAKQTFNNIHSAYKKVENISADVYEAWRIGIATEKYSLRELDDLSFLTNNLSLTDDDIYRGLAHTKFLYDDFLEYTKVHSWIDVDDIEAYTQFLRDCDQRDPYSFGDDIFYDFYKPDTIYDFISMYDDGFSGYVYLVINAYEAKGIYAEIATTLDEAKEQMKTMSKDYSDYEHYPNLKGYYTTTQAFFDYCQKPTGSFEQAVTTIENYRNEARDYYYDLEYVFED
jgi:hypothetical protein